MQYNTLTPPPALFPAPPDNSFVVWNAEPQLVAGKFSQQVSIPPNLSGSASRGIRVTLIFSAAPGTFEIDVLSADRDASTDDYVQSAASSSITAVTTPSAVRAVIELTNFEGQFALLYCKTPLQNNVTTTARITRI